MHEVTYKIEVHGIVQGVWYRATCLKVASQLSLCGYVKNLKNGNVYIEVQGEKRNVDRFVEWCKIGPENAEVKSIAIEKIPSIENHTFEILK